MGALNIEVDVRWLGAPKGLFCPCVEEKGIAEPPPWLRGFDVDSGPEVDARQVSILLGCSFSALIIKSMAPSTLLITVCICCSEAWNSLSASWTCTRLVHLQRCWRLNIQLVADFQMQEPYNASGAFLRNSALSVVLQTIVQARSDLVRMLIESIAAVLTTDL